MRLRSRMAAKNLLALIEHEAIDRFYFSHLNYAGRGNKNRASDARHRMTREAMTLLFDTALALRRRGVVKEFTSGNNDVVGRRKGIGRKGIE